MAAIFESPRDLLGQEGLSLGASDWLTVDQAQIDAFAALTGDDQWIHVDPARAATGPFGKTIAHGYYTLSLVNGFLPQLIEVRGFSAGVNVGADYLRFVAPVPVGSRLRCVGEIRKVEVVKGLKPGMQIVTAGQMRLREGATVSIKERTVVQTSSLPGAVQR